MKFENASLSEVEFTNLELGTYYVAEVDSDGNVVTSGDVDGAEYVPVYANEQEVKVEETNPNGNIEFENNFLSLPQEY